MSNDAVGREPIQIIELQQPTCSNTFGVSPCTATGTPCFNCIKTCKDTDNYDASNYIYWRFSTADVRRPLETYEEVDGDVYTNPLPIVLAASTNPTKLNLVGSADGSNALGTRASLSVTFQDIPHDDQHADLYRDERSYDPYDRSTFWAKWLARNPYYINSVCRIYEGYRGETLDEMMVREYLVDTISNPSSTGAVSLTAKDPLRLTDSNRTSYPETTSMTLYTDITDTQTSGIQVSGTYADLTESMYSSSIYHAKIGSEVLSYTGVTEVTEDELYTLTGVTRGLLGTDAADADADDSFQRVAAYEDVGLQDILVDLLFNENNAGIDSNYYNYDDWYEEISTHAAEYLSMTGYITSSTSIQSIVAELCNQCAFSMWWDERESLIKMRFVRPPSEEPIELNEDYHLLKDSVSIKDDHDQRVSRVAVSYNPFDVTDLGSESDFANLYFKVNGDFESDSYYGEERESEILSRWISTQVQAARVSTNILNLFVKSPKVASFKLDAKNRDVWTGSIVEITHRSLVDEYGEPEPTRFFITSAQESIRNGTISYTAIEFNFTGRFLYISSDDEVDYANYDDTSDFKGFWISGDDGLMSDGSEGYKIQ
jgi:hypothetical protein